MSVFDTVFAYNKTVELYMGTKMLKFICHKCKYQHYGEGNVCPKCGADNSLPKIGTVNFLVFLLGIICYFLSCYISVLGIVSFVLFVVVVALSPLSFLECKNRANLNDGFKTPETVEDVIEDRVRFPDLVKLDYEDGFKFDYGIKKLMFDIAPDSLKVYKEGMEEITEIEYSSIVDMQISDEVEIKNSVGKTVVSGVLGWMIFGGAGAVLCASLASVGVKKVYYLVIEVNNQNGENGYLQVSGEKSTLVKLYDRLYEKINILEN